MLTRILPTQSENRQILKVVTRTDTFNNVDTLLLRSNKINNDLLKRTTDIAFSLLVMFFVLTWLLPLIAVLIKMSSKGAVFFLQEREGLDQKVFKCMKFRTMKTNSADIDENGKFLQATKDDNRITKIGTFLRKTSLDELPQFFNVLIGDMSVVGPRPHAVLMNREVELQIPEYHLRHLVKPGITGLAQVSGFRGETKEIDMLQTRVDNDIDYIKQWNVFLDTQIIFKTVKHIVLPEKHVY